MAPQGFRGYWRWISKPGPGRPPIPEETKTLIVRMATERARKIQAELSNLGIRVGLTTIALYLPKTEPGKDPHQRWTTFLRNHRDAIAAMDFFVVPTARFTLLYVWFGLDHRRRRVLHAIFILTSNVQIDFNGFGIIGPFMIGGSIGTGAGVVGTPSAQRVVLRNGFVRAMANIGISLSGGGRVSDMTVLANADGGVAILGGGRVERSEILGNSLDTGGSDPFGIASGDGTVVIEQTSLGAGEVLVETFPSFPTGAFAFGPGNSCDDARCTPDGRRAFYLTTTTQWGDVALSACDPGFHMASLWEIRDVSNLVYDTGRGYTQGDSGAGPPTGFQTSGWVRTGFDAINRSFGYVTGEDNCLGYTSSDGTGTHAYLVANWAVAHELQSPWVPIVENCVLNFRVWCVQD